jgi:hypothetical protein
VIGALQSLVSIAVCALLAVTAYAGTPYLAAAVVLIVLGIALGWWGLLPLPHPKGTALVVALCGVLAVGVAVWAGEAIDEPLSPFAGLLAFAVLAAFLHELLRRDGRKNLVESLTGSFAGQTVAVLAASWVLLPTTDLGFGGIAVATAGAAGSRLVALLPIPGRLLAWVGVVAGAAAAAAVSPFFPEVKLTTALLIGAGVSAVVLTFERLLSARMPNQVAMGVIAAALAPVAVAGTAAYAAARLVGA